MHVHKKTFKEANVAKKNALPQEVLAASNQASGFPVPFTIEEFQRDVLILYVQQVRAMAWMIGARSDKLPSLMRTVGKGLPDATDIYFPDYRVEELELSWADIADTDFAQGLRNMYQYAYLGIYDASLDPMEYETIYTWFYALLVDFKGSAFLDEWDAYGAEGKESAKRCLEVAELANARRMLETGNGFSYLISGTTKDDGYLDDGQLTVRQMALLAGMEEMSIRAAANPKRANPLPTLSEEGRTRIAVDAAKAWLQSKGRYVPISRQYQSGNIDLAKRKFSNFDDLFTVVMDRKLFLAEESEKRGHPIGTRLDELESKHGCSWGDRQAFLNPDFVSGLADILDFPPSLFALRVREARVKEELAAVERALREMTPSSQ